MLITRAEVSGRHSVDLRCVGGRVVAMGAALSPESRELVFDARGGVLLPGLHDHHIHLYSLAATQSSVLCGPPQVHNREELARALLQAGGGSGWIRGVGYHDSVAGSLDRWQLDKIIPDRPLRIEHRSGKMWILNSIAADLLGLDTQQDISGIERDASGRANGRLFRLDNWLGEKSGSRDIPDFSAVSRQLVRFGVTGITDATPDNSNATIGQLTTAIESKQLLQRVLIMGGADLDNPEHRFLTRGPLKLLLDEYQLPEFAEFTQQIATAHRKQRSVAIHCVTRIELIFALSALVEAGNFPGDRIEHASVTPDEAIPLMQQTGVTVVTQPGFIYERGDQYLHEVSANEQPLLYRGRSFLNATVPLGGSSDTPYGSPDPWVAIKAAVQRTTRSGQTIESRESLTPEQALALFTSTPESPGGAPRRIEIGAEADFCLLNCRWSEARKRLTSEDVIATIRAGELIYDTTTDLESLRT